LNHVAGNRIGDYLPTGFVTTSLGIESPRAAGFQDSFPPSFSPLSGCLVIPLTREPQRMHVLDRCRATGVDRVCSGHRFNWEIVEMRNLMLVGALALLVLSPLTAAAQQRATPSPAPAVPSAVEGVSSAKVLAIGFGALLGAVAANALVAGEAVTLVGGLAGGFAASWWYDNSNGGATRAAMRQPVGVPSLASAERLALAR
jgi:hypothetical protein